jgi:hypothetical protein
MQEQFSAKLYTNQALNLNKSVTIGNLSRIIGTVFISETKFNTGAFIGLTLDF